MAYLPTRLALSVMLLAAAGTLVSACGRRGPLEPPPSAAVVTTDEDGVVTHEQQPVADRPFILDALL